MIASRLLYGAWLAAAWRHHRSLCAALADPETAQRRVLARILDRNRDSRAGRRFGFASIDSPAVFRRRVPLTRYDELEEDLRAIRGGESGVLTTRPVLRLLPSGGSTGGPKLVPFTAALGRDFARAVGAWMVDLARRHPAIRSGPAYWSVSPAFEPQHPPSRIAVGFDDDSAYLGRWLAPLVARTLIAPAALRDARPLASFRYATLRLLLAARELRLISIWHPSFLDLLLDDRDELWERLVEDIAAGTLTPREALEPLVHRALSAGLAPDPRRAAELEALGPDAGATELWPRLCAISAWGDAAAAAPFEALRRRVEPIAVEPKGLLATEAVVSIPFAGHHPVALDSTYVELIDEEGGALGVHEAREGELYEVVITTSGGLYRYRLGDVVRVDGRLLETPSIRLVGRADRVVDRVGEKLSEAFVARALAAAYGDATFPRFALLAPENGRYTLFVDDRPAEPAELLERLTAALRGNPHFAYAQDLGQLPSLALCVVPENAAQRFLAHLHACGRAYGGIKPTVLAGEAEGEQSWSEILGSRAGRGTPRPAPSAASPAPGR